MLSLVDQLPIPERSDAYGEEVWTRLRWKLGSERRRSRVWSTIAAIAAALAIAFIGGVLWHARTQQIARPREIVAHATKPGPVQPAAIDSSSKDRLLLVVVSDHLDSSERMLLELSNADAKHPLDVTSESKRAGDLVASNRIYRQTAAQQGRDAYRFPSLGPRADSHRAVACRLDSLARRNRRSAEADRFERTPVQGARRQRTGGRPRSPRHNSTKRNGLAMKSKLLLTLAAALVALAPAVRANWKAGSNPVSVVFVAGDDDDDHKDRERDRAERKAEMEEDAYDSATDALDDHDWRRAAEGFQKVAELRMSHADAALYWLAYAQGKMGARSEALSTLLQLQKSYPKSKWVEDGKTLEVEIRQSAGQVIRPEHVEDEEVKLMAINGLMMSDPERAIPILEGILNGNQPVKLKERALFVLSQSGSQRGVRDRRAHGQERPSRSPQCAPSAPSASSAESAAAAC